jgi:RNA polymerase sigma-70 factor, ECF subfamily
MEGHEELRPYLFAIAYRMLGSVAEAKNVVQEAFLRYHETDVEAESPKAYLATVTARLAIDQLRSARARREVYPGEWLPEPLVDDEAVRHAETADSLSLTFLHLLEKLSPVERAVFLLREVFDYPYHEISRIVGKSPDNCRQILTRARRHIEEGRRRFDVSREEREEVARSLIAAWEEGDTDALVEFLAPDAPVFGDGGGKAPAVPVPLVGAERVAKALIGWGRASSRAGHHSSPSPRQRRAGIGLLRRRRSRALGRGPPSRRGCGRCGEGDPQPRQARARPWALAASSRLPPDACPERASPARVRVRRWPHRRFGPKAFRSATTRRSRWTGST